MNVHQEILARWQEKRENLEAQLARDLPRLGWDQRLRQVDAAAVARALPKGSALVEYVRIEVRDFAAIASREQPEWQAARYLAFVLPRTPRIRPHLSTLAKPKRWNGLLGVHALHLQGIRPIRGHIPMH